ncbi:Gag-Pol polyprotein [Lucilia cuprina]|nr:Gag-Pol polyprotein [Lucilia cuprina]
MDLRPNRQKIINTLIASGIQFPESATMSQLRSLYDTVVLNQTHNESIPCEQIASPVTLDLTSDSSIGVLTTECSVTTSAALISTTSVTTSDLCASVIPETTSGGILYTTSVPFNYSNPVVTIPSRIPNAILGGTSSSFAATADATLPLNNDIPRYTSVYSNFSRTVPPVTNSTTSSQEIELETQIKILKMRCEMINLQKHLNDLEYNSVSKTHRINYDELNKMVLKFDGGNDDDIEKFFKKLEEYTYNYNDEEKLLCLKWLLEGTAREFMENSSNWTYNYLKGALFKIFKRVITREEVYHKLRARTLKASESCISYIISMQTIASQAKIEGQELVDIIIDGMQDNSNNISLLYGSTTVEELIACVDRYEKRRNRLYEKRQGKTQVKKPSNNNNQDSIRCFNCSQFGHMKSSCPKPIRPPGSCFICQQMGHIHKNCPNRQNISASVFPEDVVNSNEIVVVDPMLMVSVAFFLPLRNKYANYLNVSCLIDSGSPINLISRTIVPKCIQLSEDLIPTRYVGIGNCNMKMYGIISCQIKFQNIVKSIELVVIPDNDIKISMILGRNFMKKFNINLIHVKRLDDKNVCIFDSKQEINNTDKISLVSKVNAEGNSDFQLTDTQELSKDFINYNSKLSDEQILKLNNIIDKFYINPTDIIKKPHDYKIKIRLSDDVPVYCSPRRLSLRDRDEVQKITTDLLNRNIIRPSSSPYASLLF